MEIANSKLIEFILRICQFLFSLIAMSCIADVQFGFHSYQFLLLTTFSAWMVILGMLMYTKVFKQAEPRPIVTLAVDAIFIVFLFSGSIAVAVSYTFDFCTGPNRVSKCHVLKTAVAFGFIAMAAFIATFVLTILTSGSTLGQRPNEPYYGETQTPTGNAATPNVNKGFENPPQQPVVTGVPAVAGTAPTDVVVVNSV